MVRQVDAQTLQVPTMGLTPVDFTNDHGLGGYGGGGLWSRLIWPLSTRKSVIKDPELVDQFMDAAVPMGGMGRFSATPMVPLYGGNTISGGVGMGVGGASTHYGTRISFPFTRRTRTGRRAG
jgi:hypothetical protein